MKTLFLILFLLMETICYSQAMLGRSRSEVLVEINAPDNAYHQIKEGITDKGYPYISAYNKENDLFEWTFNEGKVIGYYILIDADDLNDYIRILDEKFVKTEEFKYKDYSTGIIIYWSIVKLEKYYCIKATY